MQVRLILDPPSTGSWNMAVDEALLASCSESATTTLRVYAWSEPTLSLGYFQVHEQRRLHLASSSCTMVRRATGGGAILHDQELTYSFATPVHDRNSQETQAWYDVLHRSLVATLGEFGVSASLCQQTDRHRENCFLCFQRRSEGDILLHDMKIAGSAQRRQRRAVLQHGSLLIRQSPFAPELPGIAELANVEFDRGRFSRRWIEFLQTDRKWEFQADSLTSHELSEAEQIEQSKFGHANWILRR